MSVDSRLKRLALGTASAFLLVVGTLLNVPQMYLMAVALSLIPVIYWLLGLLLQVGVTCERSLPDTCGRGERVPVLLTVRNNSIFPKFYLRLSDRLPRWVMFDGNGEEDGAILLHLRAHEETSLTYYLRPRHRGYYDIGPTRQISSDLIGLSNFTCIINDSDKLLVFPEVIPVHTQFFSDGVSIGWRDQENAATRGTGSDFQGVREYRVGDDLRRINWKTTARTGQLAVTEYALGYAKDMTIILDTNLQSYPGTSAGQDVAFETAVEICASLGAAGLKQGSKVRLMTGNPAEPDGLTFRGVDDLRKMLRSLAMLGPTDLAEFSSAMQTYEASDNNESSLVLIAFNRKEGTTLVNASSVAKGQRKSGRPLAFWIEVPQFESLYNENSYARVGTNSQPPKRFMDGNVLNVMIGPQVSLREMFSSNTL
jgi:uncharacterized protein (DUF58 family)